MFILAFKISSVNLLILYNPSVKRVKNRSIIAKKLKHAK